MMAHRMHLQEGTKAKPPRKFKGEERKEFRQREITEKAQRGRGKKREED